MKSWKKATEIRDYDNPVAEVVVQDVDYLIGQLIRHSELLGLTERQLGAHKSVLRELVWGWYNSVLPNPSGLADVSKQGRQAQGIEPVSTSSVSGKYVIQSIPS